MQITKKITICVLSIAMLSSNFTNVLASAGDIHPLAPVTVEVMSVSANTQTQGLLMQAQQAQDITITFNGQPLNQNADMGFATIIEDRTMVPVRLVTEGMGMDVEWFGDTNDIQFTSPSGTIVWHRVGTTQATTLRGGSGQVLSTLEVPSFIDSTNNRTMVSVRLIAEAFGAQVDWDGATRTVIIILEEDTDGDDTTVWTNAEDFYDVVTRHPDGTLTVRTNTGELVRIALDSRNLDLAQHAGTDLRTGFGIGFQTLQYGSPDGRGIVLAQDPHMQAGQIISGSGVNANVVDRTDVSGLGGVVNVQQVDANGNVLTNLGNFMMDGRMNIIDLPANATFRVTLVEPPAGFTNQQFNASGTQTNAQGQPVNYVNTTYGMGVGGGGFTLIAE